MCEDTIPYFPLFVSLNGCGVLLAGGGGVAARRARVLLGYGARVTVAAPEICPALEELRDRLTLVYDVYHPELLDGQFLAVAATDNPEVNRQIVADAQARGIPVCAADRAGEGNFLFPAVFSGGGVTGGLISRSIKAHGLVKKRAAQIRGLLEGKTDETTYPCGESGQSTGNRPIGAGNCGDFGIRSITYRRAGHHENDRR